MGRPKANAEVTEEKVKTKKSAGTYLSADDILEEEYKIVSTTPALDIILGGGIPEGSTVIVAAPPKIGKSILGLQVIANGQAMGKKGIYVAVEERRPNLRRIFGGVKGLNTADLMVIASEKGNILSAEQFLEQAEKALIDYPGCVMVFDSFSALCPSNEMTNQYSDQIMGGSGKLQAKFCRRTGGIINVNQSILIGIVHLAANIGGYGGMVENVGQKAQYKLDIKLRAKKAQPFEWMNGDERLGHKVEFECVESTLGVSGQTTTCWLRYGEGYSPEMEIIDLASDMGVIEKSGSWYSYGELRLGQGANNVYEFLKANLKIYDEIYKKVKDVLT